MLTVRNVEDKASHAINKKAKLGTDITIENYTEETIDAHEVLNKLDEVDKSTEDMLLKVGVEAEEQDRSGSFLQIGQTNVFQSNLTEGLELLSLAQAVEKHNWVKNLMWTNVSVDADKYTAKTALRETQEDLFSGYFIRSAPGSKQVFPVQACMFISDENVMQTTHNIIIAEENSELHLITGCATGEDVSSALHVGVSELFVKPGAKITFTMVHNWAEQVEVRPRTGITIEDNGTFINNYILTSPVKSLQSFPTAHCVGENSKALFQTVLGGKGDSVIDTGSRGILSGKGSSTEVISRAISNDNSKLFARGHLVGEKPDVKGHLECNGLVLSDDSSILAVPELEANSSGLELSHEAAVGKIDEEEIYYLTSRGLSEDEAAALIVRGFLSMDITGLPPALAKETQNMIDLSVQGI